MATVVNGRSPRIARTSPVSVAFGPTSTNVRAPMAWSRRTTSSKRTGRASCCARRSRPAAGSVGYGSAVGVRDDGDRAGAPFDPLERDVKRRCGRGDQRTVERGAHGERCGAHPSCGARSAGAFDLSACARQDPLLRTVAVREHEVERLLREERFDVGERSEDGEHGAAIVAVSEHQEPALATDAHRAPRRVEDARGVKRDELPVAVPRDERGPHAEPRRAPPRGHASRGRARAARRRCASGEPSRRAASTSSIVASG